MNRLNKEGVARVSLKPGVYFLYDNQKHLNYVGTSNNLRHRLMSYYQKDDFKAHPTKRAVRRESRFFEAEPMCITKARIVENGHKHVLKFNKI